jgi:hypothetical protein
MGPCTTPFQRKTVVDKTRKSEARYPIYLIFSAAVCDEHQPDNLQTEEIWSPPQTLTQDTD